jgi:hypothetical protein
VNAASPAEVVSDVTPEVNLLLNDLEVFDIDESERIPALALPPFKFKLVPV